jgi:hypothetical protein
VLEIDPVSDTGLAVPSNVSGEDSDTQVASPEGEKRSGGTGKGRILGTLGYAVLMVPVRRSRRFRPAGNPAIIQPIVIRWIGHSPAWSAGQAPPTVPASAKAAMTDFHSRFELRQKPNLELKG